MQQLLYGKLELPIRSRSKVAQGSTRAKLNIGGSPATGIKAIQAARVYDVTDSDDWRATVLDAYYSVAKTSQEISLYYESYPLLVHPVDSKIHPQIKNCGTVTRRPTGTTPNVLQVAKGPLRTLFRAGDYGDGDRVTVSADFASQELLLLACESKDPVMLKAFMSEPRMDLHAMTATGFAHIVMSRLGIPLTSAPDYDTFNSWLHGDDEVLAKAAKTTRNKYAKACGFGIAYGAGPSTLAENLLISLDFAKELMEGVFNLYKRIRPWQEETVEFARRYGYTLTAYGNRRHAPADLWSREKGLASRAGRQVVNAVIQSTAADILKVVLTEMNRREMRQRYRIRALRPVYDEITASVPASLAAEYALELTEIMSITPPAYPVSMKVDLSIGRTWGGVQEVGEISQASIESALSKVIG
jgi:DNA polymerase-1